jgi:hypothetical protein
MKTKFITILFCCLLFHVCFAQDKKAPRNLVQALKILQKDCPDSLKLIVKKTADGKLTRLVYPQGNYDSYKTIYNWMLDDNEDIKINRYLSKRGITGTEHQEAVILIAFKAMLLGKPVDEKNIYKPYKDLEARWNKEDMVRHTTDTLRGHYIPKDPDDCFRKLNQFLADSDKLAIKSMAEDTFVTRYYFGLGFWLMNNWGLGAGSRLWVYFKSMGVSNNESIAGIILTSYYRYLNGKPINLDEQVKKDKEFWENSKKKEIERQKTEFSEFVIGDTVRYGYPDGYISKKQEADSRNDSCVSKGVITAKDDDKFYLKIRIIETCDRKGIITFDSKRVYQYNNKLKKWEKSKKRKITRSHIGDELSFYYNSWYRD